MIRQHYEDDLAELSREIMKMGLRVEEAVNKAVTSLKDKNTELAQQVVDEDEIINGMEKNLCDKCALIIAREQPVAGDLRHLISAIKLITDIERIGDHAVHVAKGTISMAGEEYVKPLIDIPRMAELVISMLTRAIKAYVEKDADTAVKVAAEDNMVDELHKQVMRELLVLMMADNKKIEGGMALMYMSRFIERIGDHVRNICEWVVFAETGEHESL